MGLTGFKVIRGDLFLANLHTLLTASLGTQKNFLWRNVKQEREAESGTRERDPWNAKKLFYSGTQRQIQEHRDAKACRNARPSLYRALVL